MSVEENVQIVKDWFAAMGSDMQRQLASSRAYETKLMCHGEVLT